MKFYRYRHVSYGHLNEFDDVVSTDLRLECDEYDLIRETPKGYWIGWKELEGLNRWVSKTARKRYAYPTKEAALTNYIARTTRCISILKARIKDAEEGLWLAEREQTKAEVVAA